GPVPAPAARRRPVRRRHGRGASAAAVLRAAAARGADRPGRRRRRGPGRGGRRRGPDVRGRGAARAHPRRPARRPRPRGCGDRNQGCQRGRRPMTEEFGELLSVWGSEDFWDAARTFLALVLGSLGIALLAGIPAGIFLTRFRRAASPIIAALALLQTFPSLALL